MLAGLSKSWKEKKNERGTHDLPDSIQFKCRKFKNLIKTFRKIEANENELNAPPMPRIAYNLEDCFQTFQIVSFLGIKREERNSAILLLQ